MYQKYINETDLIDTVEDESKILTPRQDEYIAVYEKKSACINPRDSRN